MSVILSVALPWFNGCPFIGPCATNIKKILMYFNTVKFLETNEKSVLKINFSSRIKGTLFFCLQLT